MFASELSVSLVARDVVELELMLSLVRHTNIAVLFKDANGIYRLLAHPDYRVDVSTDEQTGDSPTAEASASVKFSLTAPVPAYFYNGIAIFGASGDAPEHILDCRTDEISIYDND